MTASAPVVGPSAPLEILPDLEAMHAWRGWHWWPDADPFEVIVGAILVQNTAWANVERALDQLRAAGALELAKMDALSQEEVELLVRPAGQFHQKARKLRAFLDLVREQGSLDHLLALPADELRRTLLATWGIGKETADCIILYASCQPADITDAYLIRLCSRLGLGPVGSNSYDAWQAWLVPQMPRDRDLLARFHALVVMHCKHFCRKSRPRCDDCLLLQRCPGSPLNQPAGPRGK